MKYIEALAISVVSAVFALIFGVVMYLVLIDLFDVEENLAITGAVILSYIDFLDWRSRLEKRNKTDGT